jgi:hypothetical protein
VRPHSFCLVLFAVPLAACAHTREEVHTSTVTAEAAPSSIEREEREVVAVDNATAPETAPRGRPRLSQTITLGQGAEQPYTPTTPAPPSSPQPNVVVNNNNNVVVQGTPGYYGYGGYSNYGGYGRPTTFYPSDGRTGGSRGTPQWGSTGWEGARRTAAPGQTPGVGGNWAPPPSYGPAQMK